jgi:hypothetical protein
LFFSVLSIPLFFIFLNKYFGKKLSLALTGLYGFSFYLLSFSHSAWNPHLIPFFTLLFLLAIYEIINKEKTGWIWPVILGISFGIGIQLHAILLILMPAMLFAIIIYLALKRRSFIISGLLIIAIAIILNFGQIQSEIKNNFKNSRIFYKSVIDTQKSKDNLATKFIKNIDCHIEANAYILTSIGDKNCDFLSVKLLKKNQPENLLRDMKNPGIYFRIIAAVLFSIFGYIFLIRRWREEPDRRKKTFLGIIIAYVVMAFVLMVPIIESPIRYFIHLFFVPYIFLGFLIIWAKNKISAKNLRPTLIFIIGIIWLFNAYSIYPVVKELQNKNKSSKDAIVLGEIETMAQYIISKAGQQKEAYLFTSNKCSNFFNPIMYVTERRGFDLIRVKKDDRIRENLPVFYLIQHSDILPSEKENRNVISTKKFGNIDIYELEN